MTYAYLGPTGRGKYQIGGDFVGQDDYLVAKYYDSIPLKARPLNYSKPACIDEHFYQPADAGFGIPEEDLPAEFKLVDPVKAYGDLIRVKQGIYLVSTKFKSCVEALEPAVHQFWPVRVTSPRGEPVAQEFHAFVIRRVVDAFDEKTTPDDCFEIGEAPRRKIMPALLQNKNIANFVFKKEVIGDLHLWKDSRVFGPQMFFSDEIHASIERAKLDIAATLKTDR